MIALIASALVTCAPCAIENVRVETGDGRTLETATVVIDRGVIASVGGEVPKGATRIDGSGKWLTPGLVESFSIAGLVEVSGVPATVDTRIHGRTLAPALSAAQSFNPRSALLPVARQQGITSVVSGPRGGLLSGRGVWVDTSGDLSRLPYEQTPAAFFGSVSQGAVQEAGGSRGAAWLVLKQAFDDARFYLRNRDRFDRGEARPLSMSPLHLEAMRPLLDGTAPMVLDVHRASDILRAIEFAQAEKIRLVVSGGSEAWLVARQLADARVPVILRPSVQGPGSFETLAARDDAATLLWKAGVEVILTTNGYSGDIRRLRQEAGIAVAEGLPHAEALRAITSRPAALFAPSARTGVVAAGRPADVVLWSGDPFELSTRAERVFIGGVEQPLETRADKLVERHRPRSGLD